MRVTFLKEQTPLGIREWVCLQVEDKTYKVTYRDLYKNEALVTDRDREQTKEFFKFYDRVSKELING